MRITGIGTAIFSGNIEVDAGSSAIIDFGDITTAYGRLYADNSSGVLMGSKSNHALTLRTNNTERLKISNAGFIYVMGDGTGGRIDATAGDGSMIFADGNGRQTIKIETMASGQSAAHEFNSSGYFGVNTSTPACRLDVRDSSTTVYPFHTTDSGTYSYTPYPHEVQIRNSQQGTQNGFTGLFFHCGEDTGGGKNSVARISAIDSGQYRADIAFGTRNTSFKERMRITATGAVGIGTTIPATRFHVVSDDYQTVRFQNNDNGSNGPYIEMYTNSSSPAVNDYSGIISFKNRNSAAEEITYSQMRTRVDNVTDGSESGHITFHTRHAGTFGERLKIESDGIVAIGGTLGIGVYASNPGCYKGMEVGSATQNAGLSWGGAAYNYTNIWAEYGSGDLWLAGGLRGYGNSSGFVSSYDGAVARAAIQIDAFGASGIHFYTSTALTVDRDSTTNLTVPERMRVRENGLVAIGSADDLGNGHAGIFQVINTDSNGMTGDCLAFFENNSIDWILKTNYQAAGTHHHMQFKEAGTTRGEIYGADGSNVGYNAGSDYRWKENIVEMTGTEGIDICKKLKPSKYNWIDNRIATGKINTVDGFIAHEVEEAGVLGAVYGEKDAVNEDGSIKGQTLDYGQMTPVLAAAIKGLIDKVETLEAKVAALES